MYIELIFIINFLIDYLILYSTKKLLKINCTWYRLIIGSLIGSLTTFILLIKISNLELIIIKIILSILLIIISFGKRNILRNIFYFYLLSIIYGGSIYLFNLNNTKYYLYYLIILIPVISYLIINELTNIRFNYQDKYKVTIYYHNKKYQLDGFIDTGNRLISPISRKSIILVNLNLKVKEVIYVPYKALNSEGIIPCIKPERLIINNKELNNYLIGLAHNKFSLNGENCILPNKLKEDLCL